MERVKYGIILFGGVVLGYLEKYRFLYVLVAVAVLLDLISGMAAAVVSGEGLSSKVARAGFLKKMMLLFSVGFGTFLDVLMPWCCGLVGIELEGRLMFSAVICVYICVGESISVLENIFRSTGTRLPPWIGKLLREAKEKLENK